MATLQEVLNKVDALSTIDLTDSQMAALATKQRRWSTPELFAVYGHRIGWMFQRTAHTRDAVNALADTLPAALAQVVIDALGDLPGVDPEALTTVVRAKVSELLETVQLTVPEED